MTIEKMLLEKKAEIIGLWIDQVLNTYEESTFFKKQKNRFANPVGSVVTDGLRNIFSVIIGQSEILAARDSLESIIKIRAVQNFSPSRAVSFLFGLKKLLGEALSKMTEDSSNQARMREIAARIDELALLGFDLYMASRERLFKIRIKELESGSSILTDGAKCPSAIFKKSLKGSTAKDSNVHSSS